MIGLILLLFTSFNTIAAPHPTTAASSLNQLGTSQVFSQMGFKLGYVQTNFNLIKENSANNQIDLENSSAKINFSIEETKSYADLENFVKKFLRDYHQFGFDLTNQKSKKINNKSVSIILDINQKNNKTKARQYFFQNGKKIVTTTCIDLPETFDHTVIECDKMMNSFYWVK